MSTASTTLVASRPLRRGLILVNSGSNAVWVTLGPTAALNQGIYLGALGGGYAQGPDDYTGIISAIAVSGTSLIGVQEIYYES